MFNHITQNNGIHKTDQITTIICQNLRGEYTQRRQMCHLGLQLLYQKEGILLKERICSLEATLVG